MAKYDRLGAFMWAREIDTGGSCGPEGIAVDSRGSSYVTGLFCSASSITFGPGETNETTLVPMANVGGGQHYVAKFDIHGALSWATLGGGTGIAVDDRGHMSVSGFFGGILVGGSSPVTFGPGEPNETTLTSVGRRDIFVTRHSRARDHRDATSSPMVDHLIAVSDVRAAYPRPSRAVIRATFTNISATGIRNPFLAVSELTDGAVLINGEGPPAGVGATVTPDAGDGVLSPGESMTVTFRIRLRTTDPFRFFVTVHGDPVP